jgi:hypothetical protein
MDTPEEAAGKPQQVTNAQKQADPNTVDVEARTKS